MQTEHDFDFAAAAAAVEFMIKLAERRRAEATDDRDRQLLDAFARACGLVRAALLEMLRSRQKVSLN